MQTEEFRRLWDACRHFRPDPPTRADRARAFRPRRFRGEIWGEGECAVLGLEHDADALALGFGLVPLVQVRRALRRVQRGDLLGIQQVEPATAVSLLVFERVRAVRAWPVGIDGEAMLTVAVDEHPWRTRDIALSPALHDLLHHMANGDHPLAQLVAQLDEAAP